MAAVEEPLLTNISEMIDMSIGSPENGVVDFNMLHAVLHCLAQQLRITDKNVELRGSVAAFPVGKPADTAPTIAITEFIIDVEAPGKYELATGSITSEQESMLVVERKKRSSITTPVRHEPRHRKKGMKSTADQSTAVVSTAPPQPGQPTQPGQPGQLEQPGQPEQPELPGQPGQPVQPGQLGQPTQPGQPGQPWPSFSKEKLSLVTLSKFNVLETAVRDLKERVYGTSPKNETILQEVRSQSNLKAITDMWSNMNVASRLDAAEEAIGKLSSLIQDLIGETTALQNQISITPTGSRPGAPSSTGVPVPAPVGAAPSAPVGAAPPAPSVAAPTALGVAAPAAPGVAAPPAPGVAAPPTPGVAAPPGSAPPGSAPPGYAPSEAASKMIDLDHLATKDELEYVVTLLATKDEVGQVVSLLATKDEVGQVLDHLQSTTRYLDKLAKDLSVALKDSEFVPPEPLKSEIVLAPPQVAVTLFAQQQVAPQPTPQFAPGQQVQSAQVTHLQERVAKLETELRKCCDGFMRTEGRIKDQLTSFQDQLEYMSKQIADVTTSGTLGTSGLAALLGPSVPSGPSGPSAPSAPSRPSGPSGPSAPSEPSGESVKLPPDLINDLQGLMKLFSTVQAMQSQLKQVHNTALNLAAEKDARQNHIDALLEQIEILKVIKLDREDMVEALADKADLRMLARKVSHDQFENACDDLSKGLEHALGKLNVQESLWQQALDDIQREIEQKLDKIELSPVKEFFNNKLKQLQENLRQMAALRREAEAAGTKKRLLRDVNCISCDANAVMQMTALPPQPSKPLPAHLSMKPYLSYELDAIRKYQANALPQRNMHDWEHVQQQMQPSKPQKVRSDTDKHLCNRYCGGSHTTTTPAQRVARLGHFIKQWGPEVLPLSSGFAAGDDGRLYKISTSEGANVGPGGAVEGAAVNAPKSPVKKPDTSKSQSKPLEIVAECRCLDPTAGRPPP